MKDTQDRNFAHSSAPTDDLPATSTHPHNHSHESDIVRHSHLAIVDSSLAVKA